MPKCGCGNCNEEAVPGYKPRRCPTHKADRERKQRAYEALPLCATEGCKQHTAQVYCGTCQKERDAEREQLLDEASLLTRLRDCTDLEALKEFIAFEILPKLKD